jgi:hypothetical protein
VEQLEKVDPQTMSHEEKLAFWINIYNALMMHVSCSNSCLFFVTYDILPEVLLCSHHLTSLFGQNGFRPFWHMGFQEVT